LSQEERTNADEQNAKNKYFFRVISPPSLALMVADLQNACPPGGLFAADFPETLVFSRADVKSFSY
jgi:hypothetical protein